MKDYKHLENNETQITIMDVLASAGIGLVLIVCIYLEPLFNAFNNLIRMIAN